MSVQICVLSHDSVDRLASLVSTKGASPVLYSFAETTFEAVRPGDVLLLNPNGFLIRRWDGVSPEAIPGAVEAWFGRDAPAPGEVVPRLPSMESWHEGKRLLLFLSTDSPVVELYLQRIRNLAAEARKAGIAVYGVFSDAAETEEGVAAFARASDFEFDCVRDAGGAIADVCAVRVAPTAVLLDEKGAVQYAGAIDSSTFGGEETREYLLSAIRALAAGAKPAVGYARPFGTGIVVYREGANPLSSRALASGRE
ncbi:MAG: hypothetical protein KatS3mg015_0650 [Fimbriimonadales bacterium]|nr:MAG: hypothetical protein KatS3mg015_0650 [Fimbriimonadales bacterium]